MQRASARIASTICALLIVCIAQGSRSAAQVPKTVDEPHAAPSDRALLVFDRPRHRQASETTFRVVNQAGGCIASLENGWQVAAAMWPGKHMLLVVAGTAPPSVQLVEAKLSAGKTYVVRLRPRVNVKSPVRIEIVRKSDQPLEQFPSDIKERSPFKEDLRKCTEWVSWKRSKLGPKAELAKQKWDEVDESFRSERTIRRNDGWTADEVAGK